MLGNLFGVHDLLNLKTGVYARGSQVLIYNSMKSVQELPFSSK